MRELKTRMTQHCTSMREHGVFDAFASLHALSLLRVRYYDSVFM